MGIRRALFRHLIAVAIGAATLLLLLLGTDGWSGVVYVASLLPSMLVVAAPGLTLSVVWSAAVHQSGWRVIGCALASGVPTLLIAITVVTVGDHGPNAPAWALSEALGLAALYTLPAILIGSLAASGIGSSSSEREP